MSTNLEEIQTREWRTGTKVPYTLYIGDDFVGSVRHSEVADFIVESVNEVIGLRAENSRLIAERDAIQELSQVRLVMFKNAIGEIQDWRERLAAMDQMRAAAEQRADAAEDREKKLREALEEIRMHLVCERLPGAHRTAMPLELCDIALALEPPKDVTEAGKP